MTTMMSKYGLNPAKGMEIGLYSLGDHAPNPFTNETISEQQRIQELIKAAVHAEQAGLDVFSVGESHQKHFISQAHAVILGAIAQATHKIKLNSSSTIISTSDPVRVYENFATLDLISDGRIELVGGRASRVGLFELLGYELSDYEALFEEKFKLLNLINRQVEAEALVNWSGEFRAPLTDAEILPRPKDGYLKIWRAVGGPAASAIKAGQAAIPMVLTTLAGPAKAFAPAVEAYRQELTAQGLNAADFPLTTASPLYIGETTEKALQEFYPHVRQSFYHSNGAIFPEQQFAQASDVRNTMNVGDAELVIDKLLYQHEMYGMQRYIAQIDFGGMPYDKLMKVIDLLGEEVVPMVKKYTQK